MFGVSLSLAKGEALALVGSNGAGKTTIARVASGLLPPGHGTVRVDGADLTGKPTFRFARAGIAHAPEGRSVFGTLSVQENLTLSFRRVLGRGGVRGGLEHSYELFPVLGQRRKQLAGSLSGGEQRMLSMARVLVEKPKVLVADELSLGLAPKIVGELYDSLTRLRADGVALLLVEQHVSHALRLADRVAVLDHGHVVWAGNSDDATQRVAQAFAVGA
ncbi:ABC transporter ATP-binding protein [Pseudofrankia sp. EUN1h]|nr:ABC transporter ATP-binding protein [Pseudofrankia sp. EUN1h]